jgi:hypothetical protein
MKAGWVALGFLACVACGKDGGSDGSGAGGSSGAGGQGSGGSGGAGSPAVNVPWDWAGVIGTGQSLAVGEKGNPVKSTTQPYENLKLSTGTAQWPLDPDDPSFEMVPLVEPIGRRATAYPSSYPTNISGETPHTAMANQVTALVNAVSGQDYVGVHGEFGENGQCMTYLKKGAAESGVNGRAYEATLLETRAITRLAGEMGKSYGVGAVIVTHGECDAGNANYEAELFQLWADYNADLKAITGQMQDLLMIVSQQNSINDRAASTLAAWRVGANHPAEVVCSGPKYQYPYVDGDNVHLVTDGYQALGEKYGQIYFERVVLGNDWQPLQPTTVERDGDVITVHFHVPVGPLTWEESFEPPHAANSAWVAGRGFEVRAGATPVTISSVAIEGDSVQITCVDLPASNVVVGYALSANPAPMATPFVGTTRWGLLRDSDPFVGATTQLPQPNYAVAFELPVP